LGAAEQHGSTFDTSGNKLLSEQLRVIEDIMATVEGSDRVIVEREDEQGSNDVSTAFDFVADTAGAVAPVETQGGAPINSSLQSFTSNLYQKLPHPLSHLLKELPQVDGSDVTKLCDFLLKAIRVGQVGQIKEPTIYEVLYPYCKGEVLSSLWQALTTAEKFDVFHMRVLNSCIPARQLLQLRAKNYERVQAQGESLAMYSQSVRDAALVFDSGNWGPSGGAHPGGVDPGSASSLRVSEASHQLSTAGAVDRR
jgi:hypothetical protein